MSIPQSRGEFASAGANANTKENLDLILLSC
jgi:hypothetical protein